VVLLSEFREHDYPRFFAEVAFELRSMIGEGDVVVAEHRMSATLPNGRPYVGDGLSVRSGTPAGSLMVPPDRDGLARMSPSVCLCPSRPVAQLRP
jgi:hypothetical protein